MRSIFVEDFSRLHLRETANWLGSTYIYIRFNKGASIKYVRGEMGYTQTVDLVINWSKGGCVNLLGKGGLKIPKFCGHTSWTPTKRGRASPARVRERNVPFSDVSLLFLFPSSLPQNLHRTREDARRTGNQCLSFPAPSCFVSFVSPFPLLVPKLRLHK